MKLLEEVDIMQWVSRPFLLLEVLRKVNVLKIRCYLVFAEIRRDSHLERLGGGLSDGEKVMKARKKSPNREIDETSTPHTYCSCSCRKRDSGPQILAG